MLFWFISKNQNLSMTNADNSDDAPASTTYILSHPVLTFRIHLKEPDGWTTYLEYGGADWADFVSIDVSRFVTKDLFTNENHQTFFRTSLSHIELMDVSNYYSVTLNDDNHLEYSGGTIFTGPSTIHQITRLLFFNDGVYAHVYDGNLIDRINGPGLLYITTLGEAVFSRDDIELQERELIITQS